MSRRGDRERDDGLRAYPGSTAVHEHLKECLYSGEHVTVRTTTNTLACPFLAFKFMTVITNIPRFGNQTGYFRRAIKHFNAWQEEGD